MASSIRGKEIGIVFQEPFTSLNPVFTVGEQIKETILVHKDADPDSGVCSVVGKDPWVDVDIVLFCMVISFIISDLSPVLLVPSPWQLL